MRRVGATTVAALAVLPLAVAIVLVLVLLHGVFSKTANEGTADRSEDTVVRLVTGVTAGSTAGESASQSTVTLLGTTGSVLVVSLKHGY